MRKRFPLFGIGGLKSSGFVFIIIFNFNFNFNFNSMNIPFIYNLLKAAKVTAILSFLGGTFLLMAYFYNAGSMAILNLGVYYALLAILINRILVFTLYITLVHSKVKQKKILRSLILMIVNVPIGLCYVGAIISYHLP